MSSFQRTYAGQSRKPGRPLLNLPALLALMCAVGGLLYWALPAAKKRGQEAADMAPSALSLTYLRAELHNSPDNPELRLQLADKLLAVGRRDDAQVVLDPLLDQDSDVGQQASMLSARLAYERMISLHPAKKMERMEARHTFVLRTQAAMAKATSQELADLAQWALWAGEVGLRATLLNRSARQGMDEPSAAEVDPEELGERLEAADEAQLSIGHPERSANLYAAAANRLQGPHPQAGRRYALLAVQRSRQSGHVEQAYLLAQRFAARFQDDPVLQGLVQDLAGELGPKVALEVAQNRAKRSPADIASQRAVVKWALFSGRPQLALEALTRVCFAGCTEAEEEHLSGLAYNAGRLKTVLRLLQREAQRNGMTRERLLSLVTLHEVLGQSRSAQSLISQARESQPRDTELLRLQLALATRADDRSQAQQTLQELLALGEATPNERAQRIDHLLAQGELRPALKLLRQGPIPGEPVQVRTSLELALALDDLPLALEASSQIVRHPGATAADQQRHATLLREQGRWADAGDVLIGAWERYGDLALLDQAMNILAAEGSPAHLLAAMNRAKRTAPQAVERDLPRRLCVVARHELASAAVDRHDYEIALEHLYIAEEQLKRAQTEGPLPKEEQVLWTANRRAMLAAALTTDDKTSLARVFPDVRDELSAREEVYVLRRLERDDDAFVLALSALREDESLNDEDRLALGREVQAIELQRRRALYAQGQFMDMRDLRSVGGHVRGQVFSDALQVEVEIDYQRLDPQGKLRGLLESQQAARPTLGLTFPEVFLKPTVELGLDARDVGPLRPSVRIQGELVDPKVGSLLAEVALNEWATDTAAMRMLALRDRARLVFYGTLSKSAYVAAMAEAYRYHLRQDRTNLGNGVTGDLRAGLRGSLPGVGGEWNARAIARFMPRFESDHGSAVPDLFPVSSHFFGAGLELYRGRLGQAQLWGHDVAFHADLTAGWLLPMNAVGFSATAGVGMPILEADQLMVKGTVDNTVSDNRGQTAFSLLLHYAFSFDR